MGIFFFLMISAEAAAPSVQWVKTTPDYASITDIGVDNQGNCYFALTSGSDRRTITVDGQTATGTSAIAKCRSDGTLIWLRGFFSNSNTSSPRIAVNAAGDCFVGAELLQANGSTPVIIGMFDAAGTLVWSKTLFSGNGFVGGVGMDDSGNCFIAGALGSGTLLASVTSTGNLRWNRSSGTDAAWENLSVTPSGEVYACGSFAGSIGLGTSSFTAQGPRDLMVAKYTPIGGVQWAARGGGAGFENTFGLAAIPSGGCWVGGIVQSQPANIGGTMIDGGFLAKVNSSISPAIPSGECYGLAIDATGRIYSAQTIRVGNRSDARVACYDDQGSLIWMQTFGGPEYDFGYRIAVDKFGQIFLCGSFQNTASFGSLTLTGLATGSPFVLKLSDGPAIKSPSFDQQPVPKIVEAGESVQLVAHAVGSDTLAFQWYREGGAISGQTNINYQIQSVQKADEGTYWVVVTNQFGRAESDHVRLTVMTNLLVAVTTIAGSGEQGSLDSASPLLAKFWAPDGGGVNGDGVIFVGDSGNNLVRWIAPPNWEVGTLAGSVAGGYAEGVGANALFKAPLGVTVDSVGDVLVADYFGNRLRKVVGSYGATMLLAGNGVEGFVNGEARNARLNHPNDLVEVGGEIYFTEFTNHTVRKIDRNGFVTTVAGKGVAGFGDGVGTNALFNGPAGIASFNGSLYVTDWNNNRVRKVTLGGVVSTVAGSGAAGLKSGVGTAAELWAPNGICADGAGNFYFTEYGNSSVRRMDTNGWVSTLAGGAEGFVDGDGAAARFSHPGGICMYPDGSLIVTDTGNNRVRRIVVDGKTNGWTRAGGFLTAELNPTLKVYGAIGERYRIEARDSLGQGDWAAVAEVTITVSPMVWVDSRKDGAGQRVYRAVKE